MKTWGGWSSCTPRASGIVPRHDVGRDERDPEKTILARAIFPRNNGYTEPAGARRG
jgi:hypothetical protein